MLGNPEDEAFSESHLSDENADAASYSAGMYFVVLRDEADIVQMEKISIF